MPEGKSAPESGGMGEFFAPMVAAIPEWFVYVVLTVMIGGYIAWGYWPHENKPIDEHVTAVSIFILLSILVFSMIIATFYRLELSSGRDNRRKLFNGPDDRHARGYQRPWDSYMWGAGSLHVLTFVLCIGVAIPALDNDPMYGIRNTWWTMFALWDGCVLFLLTLDPSDGRKEPISNSECKHGMDGYMINSSPDGQTLVESEQWKEGTPEQRKMLLAREHYTKADHKYCKICDLWYPGELRKHCWDCNKCVTGFDHHCPFLNQCIGEDNMKVFLVLLFVDLFLHACSIIIGVDVLIQMWQGDVETEARDKWGRGLFIALNVHLVMFAGVLLVPIVMLLSFQLWLQWTKFKTNQPHTTYMYTLDPRKQLRGIGAYLDVRAQELRNGVNRWKENMHHDKDGPQLVASSSSAASTRGQPANSASDTEIAGWFRRSQPASNANGAATSGGPRGLPATTATDAEIAGWVRNRDSNNTAGNSKPSATDLVGTENANSGPWFVGQPRIPSDADPSQPTPGEDVENPRLGEDAPLLNTSGSLPPLDVPSDEQQREAEKKKEKKGGFCTCVIS